MATISGHNFERLAAALGPENAERRLAGISPKLLVVDADELRPARLYGTKPA